MRGTCSSRPRIWDAGGRRHPRVASATRRCRRMRRPRGDVARGVRVRGGRCAYRGGRCEANGAALTAGGSSEMLRDGRWRDTSVELFGRTLWRPSSSHRSACSRWPIAGRLSARWRVRSWRGPADGLLEPGIGADRRRCPVLGDAPRWCPALLEHARGSSVRNGIFGSPALKPADVRAIVDHGRHDDASGWRTRCSISRALVIRAAWGSRQYTSDRCHAILGRAAHRAGSARAEAEPRVHWGV